LEPIWYNEGERKKGPFIFIFSGKCIDNHIVFSFLVNDLIIIFKELSHLFLLLWAGNVLFQKMLEALMIYLNLEELPLRKGQDWIGSHGCLQGLKNLSNYWSLSERIIFKECSERCRNLSIILKKIAIITC
jgi:hypothetical protein